MKRVIFGCVLLVAACLVPQKRMELGKLRPVEAVLLDQENNSVIIRTDTGDWGKGPSVESAVQNLKETTSGEIFMDTADYLIYTEEAKETIREVVLYMSKSVRVCMGEKEIDLEEAARYLAVHTPMMRLKDWESQETVETLNIIDGKLKILKNCEKSC